MRRLKYLSIIMMILINSLALSQGYTRISSQLKQKNDLPFPLLDSYDLLGGAVSGSDRTTLPLERRKRGMLFLDMDDDKTYQLQSGIANDNWVEVNLSGTWEQIGNDIYYSSGKVGIGQINPSQSLDVNGNQKLSGYINFTNDLLIQQNSIDFLRTSGNGFSLGFNCKDPGSTNNFIGSLIAGNGTFTGSENLIVGNIAAYYSTSGNSNTILGFAAAHGFYGNDNIAIGKNAMVMSPSMNYEANNNIVIGKETCIYAGNPSQPFEGNIIVGNNSCQNNAGGSGNIWLGHKIYYPFDSPTDLDSLLLVGMRFNKSLQNPTVDTNSALLYGSFKTANSFLKINGNLKTTGIHYLSNKLTIANSHNIYDDHGTLSIVPMGNMTLGKSGTLQINHEGYVSFKNGVALSPIHISKNYSQSATDRIIIADAELSAIQINLMEVIPGFLLTVKRVNQLGSNITLSPRSPTEKIDGQSSFTLSSAYETVTLIGVTDQGDQRPGWLIIY